MAKYRKNPVIIEAFRYWVDYRPDWFCDKVTNNDIINFNTHCEIKTLEGVMRGEVGDYIIKGVAGEIYPCKPDIFEKTYEAVEEDSLLKLIDDFLSSDAVVGLNIGIPEKRITDKVGIKGTKDEILIETYWQRELPYVVITTPDGKRYTVDSDELIRAVQNATN